MNLSYAPWVPQPGMKGMFRALRAAWGNPNSYKHSWPQATLEVVCERGVPIFYETNPHSREPVYIFNPQLFIDALSSK